MLYVRPFAQRIGISDVVATEVSWLDDELSCKIAGRNCYGAVKLEMLRCFLQIHGIARDTTQVRFFSNSASDIAAFEWADEPIAVNPTRALRSIAVSRKWPIIDWE